MLKRLNVILQHLPLSNKNLVRQLFCYFLNQVHLSIPLFRCDEEFHRTIFTISGNALLIEINNMIAGQLAQFRQNTFKIKNNIDNFIPAHDAIIRAFETRDAALGEKKMKQHMKKVSKDLESSKYNS